MNLKKSGNLESFSAKINPLEMLIILEGLVSVKDNPIFHKDDRKMAKRLIEDIHKSYGDSEGMDNGQEASVSDSPR